jgi:hypothetical protein
MDSLDIAYSHARGLGRFPGYVLGQMEPLRKALHYSERVEVVPDKANAVVGALATYEHRISVPPGAWLYGLSGSSEQAEGFTVQVFDAGSGAKLYSPSAVDYANATAQGAPARIVNGAGVSQTIVQRLALLGRPRVVCEPGALRVQVKNLSANTNRIRVCLHFAFPPEADQPGRNEWNALLEQEAALARLAIRAASAGGVTSPQGSGGGMVVAGSIDPLELPATPISFDVTSLAGATTVLVPGAAGYRIAIYAIDLQSIDPNTYTLLNGAKALRGAIVLEANGGYMRQISGAKNPHWVLDDGASFGIQAVGASRFTGDLQYRMLEHWGI